MEGVRNRWQYQRDIAGNCISDGRLILAPDLLDPCLSRPEPRGPMDAVPVHRGDIETVLP